MHDRSSSPSRLLIIQVSVMLVWGMLLPLCFGAAAGWGWMQTIPVAALWFLLNLPVLEGWLPSLLRTRLERDS